MFRPPVLSVVGTRADAEQRSDPVPGGGQETPEISSQTHWATSRGGLRPKWTWGRQLCRNERPLPYLKSLASLGPGSWSHLGILWEAGAGMGTRHIIAFYTEGKHLQFHLIFLGSCNCYFSYFHRKGLLPSHAETGDVIHSGVC